MAKIKIKIFWTVICIYIFLKFQIILFSQICMLNLIYRKYSKIFFIEILRKKNLKELIIILHNFLKSDLLKKES